MERCVVLADEVVALGCGVLPPCLPGIRLAAQLGSNLRGVCYILDEPTTGLDPRGRIELWDFLRELVDSGTTVLLTTQYLAEADLLADGILLMDDGEVVAELSRGDG